MIRSWFIECRIKLENTINAGFHNDKRMELESIAVRVLILLNTQIDYTYSSVSWNMSTYPAVFGRDVMLTCYTFYPLNNSKDCPVRQWSGGTDGRGLMYNGFSAKEGKYEEKVNLLSSQFSLIIKNFSITDINVNYTCSCGFFASTHKLQLNEGHFQYSPDAAKALITSYNHTMNIKMQMKKVYPLPNCSIYIGNRVVETEIQLKYRKSGLFYSVSFLAEYKMRNEDCKKQPRVQCDLLIEQIAFEGNITHSCTDHTTETSANENTTPTEENDNKNKMSSSQHKIGVVVGSCVLLVTFAVLSFLVWKNKQIFITKVCKGLVEIENPETTFEPIPSSCTEDAHDKKHSALI